MKAVHRRRLLMLAAFLRKLPRSRFNFHHWVGPYWKGSQDLACGTAACAMGWAATIPELRRAGLRLVQTVQGIGHVVLRGQEPEDTYGSATERAAASKVFGITDDDQFNRLFIPEHTLPGDATPKRVAREIERYVREQERRAE